MMVVAEVMDHNLSQYMFKSFHAEHTPDPPVRMVLTAMHYNSVKKSLMTMTMTQAISCKVVLGDWSCTYCMDTWSRFIEQLYMIIIYFKHLK